MRIIKTIPQLRKALNNLRAQGKTIGFVPTMGYFHEGHLTLMRQAKKDHDICVVSLYVNPTQFGPQEDLSRYPRDIKRDATMARKENVDILFIPSDNDIYQQGYLTYVEVDKISNLLCGSFRPGHFRGVATVVAKLLNIIAPAAMYLGQKDAQQVVVLKSMVRDLNFPVNVKVVATQREDDGLAMSSRNVFLSPQERAQAPVIFKALTLAQEAIKQGERLADKIIAIVKKNLSEATLGKIQYVACVSAENLQDLKIIRGDILIAVAVYFGKTRLIDNIFIKTSLPLNE